MSVAGPGIDDYGHASPPGSTYCFYGGYEMTNIDFTPLYRSTIGFDRLPSLLDSALRNDQASTYPPYDVEIIEDHRYAITLAVAGFKEEELEIQVEKGVLRISGSRDSHDVNRNYLYRGIASRSFERKFSLADHVKVVSASLNDGLLTIDLVREIPEELKPRKISINSDARALDHEEAA